jgi:hypothetical protein
VSWLLYGIVFAGPRHGSEQPTPTLPSGVSGAPVRLIEACGLGAAVSGVDSADLTPSVGRALAYAEVVEALHADRTVLPVRYGCVLGQESDVVELLRTQGVTYAERLRGLDGCVEMGIRVPTAERGSSEEGDCGVKGARRRGDVSGPSSGMTYLDRRKEFYAERERRARETAASAQRLCAALAGLFLRCKTEHCAARGPRSLFDVPLLSLHFLVKHESLPSFRAAVLRIDLTERARLLLSGPWPPYNFAVPDLQDA